jgi:excisionase family DNA binding protein
MFMNTGANKKTLVETEQQESKLPARLLGVSEVARFLGVHSSTVRRWEKDGLLKSYAIGLRHNLRFKQEDVLNFLHKSQKESAHGVLLYQGRRKTKLERGCV